MGSDTYDVFFAVNARGEAAYVMFLLCCCSRKGDAILVGWVCVLKFWHKTGTRSRPAVKHLNFDGL